MWIRNYEGNLVYFDITKYHNEKDLYIKLWKIKYNIDLDKSNKSKTVLRSITDYVNGIKDSV